MKKLIFTLLFTVGLYGAARAQFPIDETTDKVCYTEVIETPLSKDQLFANAEAWLLKTFGNLDGTQLKDKEAGKIVFKGRSELTSVVDAQKYKNAKYSDEIKERKYIYIYVITVECKNNKYRYNLTDIQVIPDVGATRTFEDIILSLRPWQMEQLNKVLYLDPDKLNKKEKKQQIEDIDSWKIAIEGSQNLEKKELTEFGSLVSSLKKAMEVNDSF